VAHRTGHLRRVLEALERPATGQGTDLTAPLKQANALLRRRGMVVVVSDFLAPLDQWERHLASMRAIGHEVAVFQVLDPAEVAFGFRDSMVFEDMESGRTLYVDPASVRRRYQEGLEAHQAALRRTAERLGVDFHSLTTDQPLELVTFEYLQKRIQRTRTERRSGRG